MLHLSWDKFHKDCEILANQIRQVKRSYDKMVCITRGGIFVGGMLGHALGIRNITSIALKLYEFDQQNLAVQQLSSPDLPVPGSRLLVVDDLLDSGRTLHYIKEKWTPEYDIDIAVLYDKGIGVMRPDFCAETIPNVWVVFPWEPVPPKDAEGIVEEPGPI